MGQVRPTLWVAGCSFAHGTGLLDTNQRYGQLVADQIKYNVSFLTRPGSSIEWAHNQIVHSDTKPNDLVLWGLTSLERFSFFNPNEQFVNAMNIAQNKFHEYNDALKILFTSDHYAIRNINLIKQLQILLAKNNINLILFFHPELSLSEHGKLLFEEFSPAKNLIVSDCTQDSTWDGHWPPTKRNFLDFGTDNSHPGSKTHQAWAEQIMNFIKDKNLV